MIWNESIECMDRESLRKIQSIRLKKTVERVYHDTPFYRKKMQELGVTPDDINSIDDIVKLLIEALPQRLEPFILNIKK